MKKIMMGLMLVLVGVVSANAQTITVKADKAPNMDFSKYKTFYWASQVENKLDPGHYFLDDLILKAQVADAVKSEMMSRGYEMTANNPDLIVNFRVFDKPVELKMAGDYGDDYWGGQKYNSITGMTSYKVEAGTLLLSLVDRKKGSIVWQGFASGLINNKQFVKDETKIHEAVRMIFEEYGARADAYSKK